MLSVNLLLNPRQLPVFRLALLGKGNVNAAIMIQLSLPDPSALPLPDASRSRESLSGIPLVPLRGLATPQKSC